MNPEKDKKKYIQCKKERREEKRLKKRDVSADEVIFIFEKLLDGWSTIRIYNIIIQQNPYSKIDKKKVEKISTGNCKIYKTELTSERYEYYLNLREKIYSLKEEK
jgi:lipoate-protein ligase A